MKISCSTAAFIDPKSSVEEKLRASIEALNTIVNYGYDGIELFIPKVFNEEQNDILFKEAEKIKGKILSMHAPKNTLHRPAKEIFPSLSRLIKRAGELETKIIVLHPPFQKDFSSLLRKVFFIFDKLINYAQKTM